MNEGGFSCGKNNFVALHFPPTLFLFVSFFYLENNCHFSLPFCYSFVKYFVMMFVCVCCGPPVYNYRRVFVQDKKKFLSLFGNKCRLLLPNLYSFLLRQNARIRWSYCPPARSRVTPVSMCAYWNAMHVHVCTCLFVFFVYCFIFFIIIFIYLSFVLLLLL